jgi:hypothetical protein
MSDVALLMRAANPVSDSEAALPIDEFDALLLLTQSRSGNVDVQELTKPVEPPKKKQFNGWFIAAAAFAVVILVVGAAMLLASPADELPPATTPPTTEAAPPTTAAAVIEEAVPTTVAIAEEVAPVVDPASLAFAEGLIADLNAGDVDGAVARFPDTMTFRSDFFTLPVIPGWFAFNDALESTYELGECKTITGGVTRCEWFRTSEHDPYYPEAEHVIYQFRLEDGVPAFTMVTHQKAGWWDTEIHFMNWMGENHGEEAIVLYRFPSSSSGGPIFLSPQEAADLKKEYVPLWRATLEG